MEDLWAFNDEAVARAIYESRIPVISAVGHEPDVTISDFVADLRAATPSNAAELGVPDQDALRQVLDGYMASMMTPMEKQLNLARKHLKMLSESPALQSPQGYFEQRKKALQLLESRLVSAQVQQVGSKKQRYIGLTAKLDAMSPLKVLTRGYALAETEDHRLIRSTRDVQKDDRIVVSVSDGEIFTTVNECKERRI